MLRSKFSDLQDRIQTPNGKFQKYSGDLSRTKLHFDFQGQANLNSSGRVTFYMVATPSIAASTRVLLQSGNAYSPDHAYKSWYNSRHVYVQRADVRLPGVKGISKKLNATIVTMKLTHKGNAVVVDKSGNAHSFSHDERWVQLKWNYKETRYSREYPVAGNLNEADEKPANSFTMFLSPFATWELDLSDKVNDGLDFSNVYQATITWSGWMIPV